VFERYVTIPLLYIISSNLMQECTDENVTADSCEKGWQHDSL